MEYIAFDAHKRYTQVSVETVDGERRYEGRIDHVRGALQQFLATCQRGSPVAVETVGNWYWIVDEIEAAGQVPPLVHARQAKRMLGMVNQTDTLDARELNRLQRAGTLPTVWIPPGPLRDQRDLPRTRRGRTHYGPSRGDIHRYLKWAFIEAASNPGRTRQTRPHRHVSRLYARVQQRKGHATAVGAVARPLAEATYWVLSKREPCRDPAEGPASSTEGPARSAHERQPLGI